MKYTLEIPDGLVAGLNKVVGRYNASNGTSYDAAGWLQLHALEIAVQDELLAEQQRLTAQAAEDVAVAVLAYRERLVAGQLEVNP